MQSLENILENLSHHGYEFCFLLKDTKVKENSGDPFFTKCYLTSAAKSNLSVNLENILGDQDIRMYSKAHNYLKTISLNLNERNKIKEYLLAAFKLLRQVPCKALAKLWIKRIEPKKKTKYPYIKGNLMKPEWWPSDVEHREPDHLQKPERLNLMCTIIMDVLPNIPDNEIIEDLIRSTLGMSLFKKDSIKKEVILSIFNISTHLRLRKEPSIIVADLMNTKKKYKMKETHKNHHQHHGHFKNTKVDRTNAFGSPESSTVSSAEESTRADTMCAEPVSYTHLDVYKRQH